MANLLQRPNRRLLVFLALLSLGGCVVVWLATSTYGAGLSSDAIRIISTGQNFIGGYGLTTLSGDPLIFCPPYYSILLGLLSIIFQSDVFTVGMYLNILVFGAIIFCAGILFTLIKPDKPIVAVLGSLIVFSSPSLVRISANVAPDPLFILFVILFLIESVQYLRKPSPRTYTGMLIMALLAAGQRYLGMAAVLTGAAMVLWQQYKKPWRAVRDASLFFLLSSAPCLAYIIFHNYLGYGTFTGPRFDPRPLGNIRIALEKFVHWFIPGIITLRTGIWIWVGLALGLLLIGLTIAWKRKCLKQVLDSRGILPVSVFSIIYGMALIFLLSYKEHRPLLWDRIHIVMLVPLLVLLIELLSVLIPPTPVARTNRLIPVLLIAFFVWLVYPIVSTYGYVVDSIQNGEASLYNIHNTRSIRESKLAQYILTHPFGDYGTLFSNYNETAWFLTRRNVRGIPSSDQVGDWHIDPGSTYLIWFNLPELSYMPKTMLTLEEISKYIPLEQVYAGEDGSIYRICQTNGSPRCSEYH